MKHIGFLAATALLLAIGGTAGAGQKSTSTVIVTGGVLALGSLADARSSANTVEYIGCNVTGTSTAAPYAFCSAKDAAGNTLTCSTSNAGMVQAAASIGTGTYMYFGVAGGNGICTGIAVYNQSYYAPTVP